MGQGLIIKAGARKEMAFLSEEEGRSGGLSEKQYQFDDDMVSN